MKLATLNTITKQDFAGLHKRGKLGLVASLFNHTKEQVSDKLVNIMQSYCYSGDIPSRPVSRVDVANQGGYMKTKIYLETIHPNNKTYSPVDFVYLETIIDNSKCDTCSWDTVETNTLVYKFV